MDIIFVCNEELKGGMQGYSLCLLGNQLKFQLQPMGCKSARTYYVINIVGTLVRFEVGHSRDSNAYILTNNEDVVVNISVAYWLECKKGLTVLHVLYMFKHYAMHSNYW